MKGAFVSLEGPSYNSLSPCIQVQLGPHKACTYPTTGGLRTTFEGKEPIGIALLFRSD